MNKYDGEPSEAMKKFMAELWEKQQQQKYLIQHLPEAFQIVSERADKLVADARYPDECCEARGYMNCVEEIRRLIEPPKVES